MKTKYFLILMVIIIFPLFLNAQESDKIIEPSLKSEGSKDVKGVKDKAAAGSESAENAAEDLKDTASKEKAKWFGMEFKVGYSMINGVSFFQLPFSPEIKIKKFAFKITCNFELAYIPESDKWTTGWWEKWLQNQDRKPQYIITDIIDYIRYGQKGEKVFLKLGLLENVHMGHGTIFRRYHNMTMYPYTKKTGFLFDLAFNKWGFEYIMDDIFDLDILGFRLHFKPLSDKKSFMRRFYFGLSLGTDLDPRDAEDTNKAYSFNNSALMEKKYILGADIGIPLFEKKHFALLLYLDYVKILNVKNGGWGLTPGLQGNIFGFILTGELRYYWDKYNGVYFDALYDTERETKLASLEFIKRSMYWFVSLSKEFAKLLEFEVSLEGIAKKGCRPNLYANFETQRSALWKFTLRMQYEKKYIQGWKDMWSRDDALIRMEIGYAIAKHADIKLGYEKRFKKNSQDNMEDAYNMYLATELVF